MVKQTSVNLDITSNADGFDVSGGTTSRKLTLSGADVAIAGSGSAVITFPGANATLAILGANTFTDDQTIGANNIIMTGSIADTDNRVTKGWFTNLECTNDITIGGTALASTYAAIAQTMYIGTTQVAINRGSAALTLAGITLTTPDIGTPSAGVLTNCSGTASSLTAGAVTGFTPASGSLTLSGADALTLTTTAETNVTLPTTGTLLANVSEDTTPELGGEMDCGAHSIGFTQQTTTGDGTTTIDWKLGNKFYFTFGAQSDTFTFTAPSNPCNLLLVLKQDGTGSRTATWPNMVMWPSGTAPTLSTAGGSIDIISFYYDGTNYFGVASLDFSVPA